MFLWVHYFDPHSAYLDRDEFKFAHSDDFAPSYNERYLRSREMDRAELDHVVDLYDEEIAVIDLHMGRLLDAGAARTDERDGVIVVTADHGELFGEHGLFGHGTVHEPVVRLPLVLAGSRVRDLAGR